MALTQTTKLEAVNTMIGSIGEAPVNSLGTGLSEANVAEQILDETSRAIQTKGWWFNTDIMTLSIDVNDEYQLPTQALKVDTGSEVVVMRGNKLYDRSKGTYKFPDIPSAEVSIVMGLDFEELPEVARQYIKIRAARIFQDRTVGSNSLHGFGQQDELDALIELQSTELENGHYNIFDNEFVANATSRGGYPTTDQRLRVS